MTSSTGDDEELSLDPALIDRLAEIVCGNDRAYYRAGWEMAGIFARAGWSWVGDDIEPSRGAWAQEILRDRRATPAALADLVRRLVDPVEYVHDTEAHREALEDVNEMLGFHLRAVDLTGERPAIVLVDKASSLGAIDGDEVFELDATIADIVNDDAFGAQLERRLNEARACWGSGAYLAATIVLGSLLEGVLYDRALTTGAGKSDNLDSLIKLAVSEGWINRDIGEYAHILRNHRNLIHPRKQHRDGHSPDTNSVRIAWNIAIATLNSMAAV